MRKPLDRWTKLDIVVAVVAIALVVLLIAWYVAVKSAVPSETVRWLAPQGWSCFGDITLREAKGAFVFSGTSDGVMGISMANAITPDDTHDVLRVQVSPLRGKTRFAEPKMFKVSIGASSEGLSCMGTARMSGDDENFVAVGDGEFNFVIPKSFHGESQELKLTFWKAELDGFELTMGLVERGAHTTILTPFETLGAGLAIVGILLTIYAFIRPSATRSRRRKDAHAQQDESKSLK